MLKRFIVKHFMRGMNKRYVKDNIQLIKLHMMVAFLCKKQGISPKELAMGLDDLQDLMLFVNEATLEVEKLAVKKLKEMGEKTYPTPPKI